MDILQDYALLTFPILHDLEPYTTPVLSILRTIRANLAPLAVPALNRAAVLAHESPAIVSLGVLLLVLLVAMQILAFCRRVMMFWARVVVRLVFWGVVGALVSLVWQRGLERTVGDAVAWGVRLKDVWWREYRRWEELQGQDQNGGLGRATAGSAWR
ncbi:hypothetical protein LZ554_005190 [Drepanopeziza brunnea f. sp. 'monogermtubi']|nr:hypothetical protein LZ554_005190 [Drepanopeziza brunnea f. sp. 'monogermtubi']